MFETTHDCTEDIVFRSPEKVLDDIGGVEGQVIGGRATGLGTRSVWQRHIGSCSS